MAVKLYVAKGQRFWLVDAWITLPDGRPYRFREKRLRTKAEAKRREVEVTAQANKGLWNGRLEAVTVREVWEDYKELTLSKNKTGKDDVGRAAHLLEHLGGARVTGLNAGIVRWYRSQRAQEKTRRGTPPSVATVNREIGLLKRMLNHAAREGAISVNPVAHVRLEAEDNIRHNVIDDDRFEALYVAADDWFKPILMLAYDSGMRRAEILNLRWSQVDLKARTITLEARDTKTRKARLVPLTRRVHEALRRQPRVLGASAYVFANPRTGRPYSEVKSVLVRACDKIGLKGFWFHDLRRCFITNARKRGISESVIMRISGHRSRNVFERYNVVDETDLWEAFRIIEKAREEKGSSGAVAVEG